MKKHFNTFSLILGLSALLSGLSACIARDDIDFSETNSIVQKEREKGLHILESTVGND